MGCHRYLVGRNFVDVGGNHIPEGAYVRAVKEKVFKSFDRAALSAIRGRVNGHAI